MINIECLIGLGFAANVANRNQTNICLKVGPGLIPGTAGTYHEYLDIGTQSMDDNMIDIHFCYACYYPYIDANDAEFMTKYFKHLSMYTSKNYMILTLRLNL